MTQRVYDEATKKAFAGLLPFAPGSYATVGLDCFDHIKDEALRPVFRLRDLTSAQLQKFRASQEDTEELITGIFQDGVMGPWENLVDSEFKEIQFSKEAIAALPLRWKETLFKAAIKLCSPNKVEREALGS